MTKTPEQQIAELKQSLAMARQQKTLRDEFAMAALPTITERYGGGPQGHVKIAYEYADAMMQERNK